MVEDYVGWVSSPVLTFRRVPPHLARRLAHTTKRLCVAVFSARTVEESVSAFLLLLAHHRLLLAAPVQQEQSGKHTRKGKHSRWDRQNQQAALVRRRLALFESGQWDVLLSELPLYSTGQNSSVTDKDTEELLTLRRVLQLVRAGELRRAMQRLTSPGLALGTPSQLLQALRSKFLLGTDCPQGTPLDVVFSRDLPTLLEKKALRQTLSRAPRKSGPGVSGSRFEHWQVLLGDDEAFDAFYQVVNALASGAVPGGRLGPAAVAFLLGNLTPLRKGTTDVRPLAAPETLRRLVGKALCVQFKGSFGRALAPEQCAVALPGGAEVVQKTLGVFADCHSKHVFFKLDARNAHNEQWRRSSVDAFSLAVPELAGFSSLCYCRGEGHSKYVFRSGGQQFLVESDAGVDQGDSLAPVLFAFGIQGPARSLLQELRRQAGLLQGDTAVLVLLYLDDVYVAVPQELASSVLPLATSAFGPGLGATPGCGLTLRDDKCAAWCPSGEKPSGLPPLLQWQTSPLVVLGSALSDPDTALSEFLDAGVPVLPSAGQTAHWELCASVALEVGDKVMDLFRKRDVLSTDQGEAVLNTVQCCQVLLRSCVETKLLHLLRAYSPDALGDRPRQLAVQLQDFWEELLECQLSSQDRLQMALPVSRAGLGVGSLVLRHAAAFVGSWCLCLSPVLARLSAEDGAFLHSGLLGSGNSTTSLRVLGACECLQKQGVPVNKLPRWDLLASQSVQKAQRFFTRFCSLALYKQLLSSSGVEGRARLRSCSGVGSGAFLVCAPSEAEGTELVDAVFTHAVRWRLGLPVCAKDLFCQRFYSQGRRRQCRCALDRFGDHLVCCGVGGHKILLHSRIVAVLRGILRDSGAVVPDREVQVLAWGTRPGEAARLEIEFTVAGVRRFVDVVVKHPRARHVLASAADKDGAAAAEGELSKLRRYPAVPEAGLDTVLPFGVETFGRLGDSALRLLRAARARVVSSDRRFDGWLGHLLVQRWHARLSCALAAGLWEAAAASWGFSGARAGLWDDAVDSRWC